MSQNKMKKKNTMEIKTTLDSEHLKKEQEFKDKINNGTIDKEEFYNYYIKNSTIFNNYYNKKDQNKGDLYYKYKESIDKGFIYKPFIENNTNICEKCDKPRLYNYIDSIKICPNCGDELDISSETEKPSYKETQYETNSIEYDEVDHFIDQLIKIQGKEFTKIPESVLACILVEFTKEGNNNLADLSYKQIKEYLSRHKNIGFDKYYDNRYKIYNLLTGTSPLDIPQEIIEILTNEFIQFIKVFPQCCPPERLNCITTHFIGFKLCQKNRYNECLSYFNLLKGSMKVPYSIWKKACKLLNWEYIPHEEYMPPIKENELINNIYNDFNNDNIDIDDYDD